MADPYVRPFCPRSSVGRDRSTLKKLTWSGVRVLPGAFRHWPVMSDYLGSNPILQGSTYEVLNGLIDVIGAGGMY